MKFVRDRIGPLDALHVRRNPSSGAVVLLHGYGADAQDLAPLAGEIRVPSDWSWYFPEAPLEVEIAPGFNGRSWFPLRVSELEGGPWRDRKPEGLERARDMLLEFIGKAGLDLSSVVLGGFSQGSMVAVEAALHSRIQPRALLVFSGTLLNASEWEKKARLRAGLRFFQSHGEADPMLPFEEAENLNRMLIEAGLKGEWHPFRGGHEIPNQVIQSCERFLFRPHP